MWDQGTKKLLVLTAVVIMGATSFAGCFGSPPPPPPINLPPSATAAASSTLVAAGSAVTFEGSGLDLDGTISAWKWDFGDEMNATGQNVSHAFDHQGSYFVTLNVTDNGGATYDTRTSGFLLKVTVLPNFKAPTAEDQPLAGLTLWSASTAIRPGDSVSWSALTSRGSWNFENATPPTVVTYLMNFGDGSTDSKSNTSLDDHTWDGNFTHAYATTGKFAAKLTVTTNGGKSDVTYWDVLVVGTAPTPGIKNRDTMIIQSFGQPNNLDPAIAYDDASNAVIQAVYETLITYDGQKADAFIPLLAEEVPTATNGLITNNNLTYTFHLRHNVSFHSGNPLRAQDVVYAFQRIIDIDDADSAAWIYTQVLNSSSITATDDYTVVFNLMSPYGAFVSTLAYPAASIVSKATVNAHPNPGDTTGLVAGERNTWMLTNMDGTGPFRFRSWTNGQQIVLDKNHAYWDTVHAARMEHIVFQYITEFSTRLINLRAGDADIISVVSADLPGITDAAKDASNKILIDSGQATWDVGTGVFNQKINVTAEARAKFGSVPYPDNVPSDFFTDVNMRKAFALAYNRSAYIENVAHGLAFKLEGIIPKGMYGYNPNLGVAEYDNEAAKAAYNLTKWVTDSTYNPGGYAAGFNLTVAYNCGNTNREQYSLILKGTPEHPGVEALGPNIHVNSQCIEWATYLDVISPAGGRLPALATWIIGWGPDYADPDDYIRPFLEGGNYYARRSGFAYPEMDFNITEAAKIPNGPERQALYDSIQKFAVDNHLYVYNIQGTILHVSKTWVKGWYANPMWSGKELGGNLATLYKE